MKTNFFLLILFFIFTVISSCTKDTIKPLQILMTGTWKYKDIVYNNASVIKDCDKDDTFNFGETIVKYSEGNVICDPSSPAKEIYEYTLSTDGKTLTVDGKEADVTITQTNLKIKKSNEEYLELFK